MPEYLAPGVYIEEVELGPRPIEGVSTSTAGFLGVTLRGPIEPRLVTGFEEFKRLYGGYVPSDTSTLPFAIDGFFMNGGKRCFIARITSNTASMEAMHDGKIKFTAIGPGSWANRIAIKIDQGSIDPTKYFRLTVMYWDKDLPNNNLVDPTDILNVTNPDRRDPDLFEVYDNLSVDNTSNDFFERVINSNSSLIIASQIVPSDQSLPAQLPLTMISSFGTPGTDAQNITIDDYNGREFRLASDEAVYKSGLLGFEQVDEIAIVVAPDYHELDEHYSALIQHCEKMRDRFLITHSIKGKHSLASINNIRPPQDTTYAAFYFPWIKVFNPLTKQDTLIPPSGHIAGIYAKTDIERGVFKAPANEVVRGARSLEFQLTKENQDLLNPRGVNCIRIFPARGIRVWGARTASTNSLWKYVSVRRYFIYLGESIDEGTQWVVFEPNDEKLWARVKQTITQFLMTEWRNGALMGMKAEDAFFVKVDRTTMTQSDIDNGRLICIIGVAVVKPAEFVIFRLAQFQGGSEFNQL
jgi:uncharacterized protein